MRGTMEGAVEGRVGRVDRLDVCMWREGRGVGVGKRGCGERNGGGRESIQGKE